MQHLPLMWLMWTVLNSSWLRERGSCQEWKSKVGKLIWWDTLASDAVGFSHCMLQDLGSFWRWQCLCWHVEVILGRSERWFQPGNAWCYAFSFSNEAQVKSSSLIFIFCLWVFLHTLLICIIPSLMVTHRRGVSLTSPTANVAVERDAEIGRELTIWYFGLI